MRKLTIIEFISLDGVIQAPGGPEEDRDGGFAHGGWVAPIEDAAVGALIDAVHGKPFDLLLGRHTYDIWAAYWPKAKGAPLAGSFNKATKYVVTNRPETLEWGPVAGVGSDVVEGVRRVKASDGPDLILWGSSTLTPVLLSHDLADELLLLVYPVLLGSGKRLFAGVSTGRELALVSSTAGSAGVVINTYRPAGALRTGAVPEPSA